VGSGDTYAAWEILNFEVAFTVCAGNVGVGWTHDLGGFMGPIMRDPEMYLRWLQFGTYSYLFRTHCDFCEIRIWMYPNYLEMKETFLMRNSLIPYIYTAAWSSYTSGVMLVTPLYFKWPLESNAYKYNGTEYIFGPDLLVAPITNPVNPATNTTTKAIWIPVGDWIDWATGELFTGPQEINPVFGMADVPVYARAGSIIPMKYPTIHGTVADPLILTIFASIGTVGIADFYEDDGETLDYTNSDAFWLSQISQRTVSTHTYILYEHVAGKGFTGQLENRGYEFHLRGVVATDFKVTCNGVVINQSDNQTAPGWWLKQDNKVNVLVIAVGSYPMTTDQLLVDVTYM